MSNSENKTEKTYLVLLLVVFTILGCVISLGIGAGLSYLAALGKFSFWKPIASGEIVPTKILYANSNSVWVATDRWEVYFHKLNCLPLSADCATWNLEEHPRDPDSYEVPALNNEECSVHVFVRPNAPPQNSIQCVYASRVHTLNDGFTYFALSTDNQVRYWRTPNRVQTLFILFIFGLIGPFAGFFLGKKLTTHRKGYLKDVFSDFVSLLAYMFLFAVAGFVFGGIAGNVYSRFHSRGVFTHWELLESPVVFTKIVNANTNTVWAQSQDNRLFYRRLTCTWEECDFWVETDTSSEEPPPRNEAIWFGDTCSFKDEYGGLLKPQEHPGNVIACTLVRGGMYESAWTVYYALLEDGTIWSWKHTSDMYYFIFVPLYITLTGIVSGAILGMVVFVVRKARRKENSAKA